MQALRRATATDTTSQALLQAGKGNGCDDDIKECLWDTALFLSTELKPVQLTPDVDKVPHPHTLCWCICGIQTPRPPFRMIMHERRCAGAQAGTLQVLGVGNEAFVTCRRQTSGPTANMMVMIRWHPGSSVGYAE